MRKKKTLGSAQDSNLTDNTSNTSVLDNSPITPIEAFKFKIWKNHFDISEIKKSNYQQILKDEFCLTTKKIAFLAMMLVINIVFSLVSFFLLGLFPIGGFLTFNIVFWTYLISYMGVGFVYTVLLLEIGTWFRMGLGVDATSCIAMNLSDLTMLIIFCCFLFLINYFRLRIFQIKTHKQRWAGYLTAISLSYLIASLLTPAIDVAYNKYFLLDLFYSSGGKPPDTKPLLIIVFWFNIVQYLINFFIFLPTFKVSYVLLNRYYQKT